VGLTLDLDPQREQIPGHESKNHTDSVSRSKDHSDSGSISKDHTDSGSRSKDYTDFGSRSESGTVNKISSCMCVGVLILPKVFHEKLR
jgi:hypothetical protein